MKDDLKHINIRKLYIFFLGELKDGSMETSIIISDIRDYLQLFAR